MYTYTKPREKSCTKETPPKNLTKFSSLEVLETSLIFKLNSRNLNKCMQYSAFKKGLELILLDVNGEKFTKTDKKEENETLAIHLEQNLSK